MAEEKFTENLIRAVAAELHVLTGLAVAREMFGKSYFSLGPAEKILVDRSVMEMVATNYQSVMTPESLALQSAQQPMGFRSP
jgi:hypothetical protein